jgi:hypothetical protein
VISLHILSTKISGRYKNGMGCWCLGEIVWSLLFGGDGDGGAAKDVKGEWDTEVELGLLVND